MQTAYAPEMPRVSGVPAVLRPLVHARDWLDQRGRPAWIAAMVLSFVFVWPVGLAILGYMIWSKRMFSTCCRDARVSRHNFSAPTGNSAFDAYRAETLKRLEDEHTAFVDFLQKLREAKDKAEFDQFMDNRSRKSDVSSQD